MHMNSLAPISMTGAPMLFWKWGVEPEAMMPSILVWRGK
jgi:hypothetical protein